MNGEEHIGPTYFLPLTVQYIVGTDLGVAKISYTWIKLAYLKVKIY
jgi:hypothetical protein